jgi:hypothetical protein
LTDGVTDFEITSHLGSTNLYGYVFVGHGASAAINTYSHLGENVSGVGVNRYTKHGIAFLILKACETAARVHVPGKRYRYNAWESNVATRGWFSGYTESVWTHNEIIYWVRVHGRNDGGWR